MTDREGLVVVLTLPWPPSELSPNGQHGHWSRTSKARKKFRERCWIETLEQLRGVDPTAVIVLPKRACPRLCLRLEFAQPDDRRHYDLDNLLARMKSGVDGLAAALQINDACIEEITVARAGTSLTGGHVLARLSQAPQ